MPNAILCLSDEGVDSLVVGTVALPSLKDDEVLIRVHYAGVNYPDTLIIQGKYQFQPEWPFSPGQEVSGEVQAVGKSVTHVTRGDRVVASMTWGGYAEMAKAQQHNVYLLPTGIAIDKAAAILETYGTVMHALQDRGRVRAGETLAVLGAAGGIGSAAIQLGRVLGMRTIAVCSSEVKRKQALKNGADVAIGYGHLKASLKQHNVHVVLDPVGGEAAEQAFRALLPGGRHLVVGFASGQVPAISFNLPLLKSASIVGVFWGAFWREHPEANRANVQLVLQWFAEGQLDIHELRVLPLAEAGHALKDLMERKSMGKTVLAI